MGAADHAGEYACIEQPPQTGMLTLPVRAVQLAEKLVQLTPTFMLLSSAAPNLMLLS